MPHYQFRKQIDQKSKAILEFRRDYPEYGKRVVAIDACSQEIGCRPEVFACAFRLLKNHVTPFPTGMETSELPQLKISYHVGEDFLDVVDGLRAIDEAIVFLNLKCGDRLGHALALGVDVEEWYQSKSYRIMINKMRFWTIFRGCMPDCGGTISRIVRMSRHILKNVLTSIC